MNNGLCDGQSAKTRSVYVRFVPRLSLLPRGESFRVLNGARNSPKLAGYDEKAITVVV